MPVGLCPHSRSMVAVDMSAGEAFTVEAVAVAGFMAAEQGAVADFMAVEADPEAGPFRRPQPVTELHELQLRPLRARQAVLQRGQVPTFLDPAAISLVEINALGIPPQRLLRSPTGSGTHLAALAGIV